MLVAVTWEPLWVTVAFQALVSCWFPGQVQRTVQPLIGGSTQQIIDRLGEYQDAGLQHLIATPRRAGREPYTPDGLIEDMQQFAEEIMPAVK